MTVSYSSTVATVSYNSFARLLLRWRGSVYKAVWPILLIFCGTYTVVALTFQLLPNETDSDRAVRRKFVQICAFTGHLSNALPVSFFLGFFVNLVVDRWWQRFLNLPTPDSVCTLLSSYLVHLPHNNVITTKATAEERPLLFRRTIARYLNLSVALCFHSISLSVKRKIPTLEHLVSTGLMTNEELLIYQGLACDKPFFFVPLVWSISLLTRAHYEGMILHDRQLDALITSVVQFWNQLQTLFVYDYVNVPLVYNQVVMLVVYLYMGILVLSQQFADPVKILRDYDKELLSCNSSRVAVIAPDNSSKFYRSSFGLNNTVVRNQTTIGVQLEPSQAKLISTLSTSPNIPVFAILALICYAGWLRVAESHEFPFGDEDDDFEAVPLMDRNFNTSLWFVDQMMDPNQLPPLLENSKLLIRETNIKPDANFNPDSLQYLSPLLFNQGAMGRKRTPTEPTQYGDHPTTVTPEINITAANDESVIPELPCPDELRRRTSRHFFAGSMTRVYGDEHLPTHSFSPTASSLGTHPSLPSIEPLDAMAQSTAWLGSIGMNLAGLEPPNNSFRRLFSSAQSIVPSNSMMIRDSELEASEKPTNTVQL